MPTDRRAFLVTSVTSALIFVGYAYAQEEHKRTLAAKEAKERLQMLTVNVFEDAKKYNINLGKETPVTIFEAVEPDAFSILERRLFIPN